MSDVLAHYVDVLLAQPAFSAYQEDLRRQFDASVDRLLNLPPETAVGVVMQRIGELRGLREALRAPERIAERQGDEP